MGLKILKLISIDPIATAVSGSPGDEQRALKRISSIFSIHLDDLEFEAFTEQARRFYYLYKAHEPSYEGSQDYLLLTFQDYDKEHKRITATGAHQRYTFQIIYEV